MLIDLKLFGKTVLIVGGGKVGQRKAKAFLNEKSRVIIASKSFTPYLIKLGKEGKIQLAKVDKQKEISKLKNLISKSDIVFSASNNRKFNEVIIKNARSARTLVCAVDNPLISDFTVPAVAKIGDFRIAVSTQGKSPAMARTLRKRVEETITIEDILQVKLQEYVRRMLKNRVAEGKFRRYIIYKIIKDNTIRQLLRQRKLKDAEREVQELMKTLLKRDSSS